MAPTGDNWWRSAPLILKGAVAVVIALLAVAVGYYVLTLILIGIGSNS